MSVTRRTLPSLSLEGVIQDFRSDAYGNLGVNQFISGPIALADEGSYFIGVNAASGTAITSSIATAYSATASAFVALRNTAASGSNKRIYLDYIKLQTAVAPANATEFQAVVDIDTVLARFTSGGTVITPANVNVGSSIATSAALNVGALTTVALSSVGISLGQVKLRTAIPVVGDTYYFVFGQKDAASSHVLSGTTAEMYTFPMPPVVLPAQAVVCLSLFGAAYAVTAATYFVTVGWAER